MDSPVIQINHLYAGYGDRMVLEDINFVVYDLDFVGIIGPNGGGKTTFLKVLLGLLKPHQGEVKILDRPPVQGRRYIGYVPQLIDCDRAFPITVRDVVRMGCLSHRRLFQGYSPEDDRKVGETLALLDLTDLADRPIGALSGGQRQRVYIARALVGDPKILILDEPTANVDPQVTGQIYRLLQRLNEWMTIVMISHDMGAIATYVKTVGCLNRRLFYHGEKQVRREVLEHTYGCEIEILGHGLPHRVLPHHENCDQGAEISPLIGDESP